MEYARIEIHLQNVASWALLVKEEGKPDCAYPVVFGGDAWYHFRVVETFSVSERLPRLQESLSNFFAGWGEWKRAEASALEALGYEVP